jgi:hypothetical protein
MNNYKAAAEKTDEAERLLTPPFRKKRHPNSTRYIKQRDLDDLLAIQPKVCAICNARSTNLMRPGDAANLVLERDEARKKLAQSEAHHHKLAEELPLMRKENQRLTAFLQDAAAFVQSNMGNSKTWSDRLILSTLIHDIIGLAKDEPCFLPRVTGYSQKGHRGK